MAIATGSTILAADVNNLITIVRKSADQTVNDSAVVVNDTHLLKAVGASDVWAVFMLLRITTLAAADFRFAFAVPAAGAVKGIHAESLYGLTATEEFWETFDLTAETSLLTAVNRTDYWFLVWLIYVGGGTAGNLQLQWAQRVADVSDTKVLTNSYLKCHKLA